jgi:hypothetical protein
MLGGYDQAPDNWKFTGRGAEASYSLTLRTSLYLVGN